MGGFEQEVKGYLCRDEGRDGRFGSCASAEAEVDNG